MKNKKEASRYLDLGNGKQAPLINANNVTLTITRESDGIKKKIDIKKASI